MKVYLKAKVEPLDERFSSLGAMVRNDVEELEKKFTRRLAATNDDVDLLMEKGECLCFPLVVVACIFLYQAKLN